MTPLRLLLVDDQVLFRRGLRALFESRDGFVIVGEASDGAEAIEMARATRPDVVLMDIHMPVCNGVTATAVIKSELPQSRVVALTVSDEDDDLFEAVKNGADGYLLKNLEPDELFGLLRGVLTGEAPISPAVAGRLLREFRGRHWRTAGSAMTGGLTPREQEILSLVAAGLSNAEIAGRLWIVEGTVKNHLHNILEKLQLENRVQAAAYAIRQGLVQSPEPPVPNT
jgi:two-component system, NarL family, nitrate/nitrite response regulator NarL